MTTTSTSVIYCERLSDQLRVKHTADLFGIHFPMRLEPTIFGLAGQLSPDYDGGFWHFHALSNGGFYMAPARDTKFSVLSENGFDGSMSADAFGITVCLYAYSLLAFREDAFAEVCAEHFHLLRMLALNHIEATSILAAID
ncbi:antirestriction protein [Roseateles toxinivorans]|uniref:Antirestriction protein n=1 Tax=Roseateles toxinivorans TaxID=270368 RepID=A0A4R6QUA8_9BURK|nr:antirestriction protein [Roseateles toxinivorans]TDP74075.1 antirestriction protein [Roseateles toxinivorans]